LAAAGWLVPARTERQYPAFAVDSMNNSLGWAGNSRQAQPLPKHRSLHHEFQREHTKFLNRFIHGTGKFSSVCPPLPFHRSARKSEMYIMPAALVLDGSAEFPPARRLNCLQLLDTLLLQFGISGDDLVQIINIGFVMFVMMDFHVSLHQCAVERIERVSEGRQPEWPDGASRPGRGCDGRRTQQIPRMRAVARAVV